MDVESFFKGLQVGLRLGRPPYVYGRGWTADPAFLIDTAGTVFCENSGDRTPYTKVNDGLAICCTLTNCNAGEWGGGWTWSYLISTSEAAALSSNPVPGAAYELAMRQFDYLDQHWYCYSPVAYNQRWGGATDVISDWPVFDWQGAQAGIINGVCIQEASFLRVMELAGVRRA